jgi:hypothetical protein
MFNYMRRPPIERRLATGQQLEEDPKRVAVVAQ